MSLPILASQSGSRRAMLDAAGVAHEAIPAHLDEAAITDAMRSEEGEPPLVARALAEAKAQAVSRSHPGCWVIGSDSMVSVDGRLFDKPRDRDEAEAHLRAFSGRTIMLDSAVALVRDGIVSDVAGDRAELAVRKLGDRFIADYLDAEWPAIAACVGCFRIEGRGVQLFESVAGSHFTILGMPLLPLLGMLRAHGIIAS